ncbi:hypothetical protein ACNOYE_35620 [Nannocystaceae bacterium ST9]
MQSTLKRTPALALLALVACTTASSTNASDPDPSPRAKVEPEPELARSTPPSEPVAIDERFAEALLAAARDHRTWGRVDERPNLAPVDCRMLTGLGMGFPSHVRLSGADEAEHGHKLYYLFAGTDDHRAREHYAQLGKPGATIPIGFTIVKQSWTTSPNAPPPPEPDPIDPKIGVSIAAPPPITWIEHAGERLYIGEPAGLYVMRKVGAPDMPGTDAG